MPHPNADLRRKGYDAPSKGDLDTIRNEVLDVVFHVAGGRNPLSGDYRGADEVFGFFGRLFELSGGPSCWSCTTSSPMTVTPSD